MSVIKNNNMGITSVLAAKTMVNNKRRTITLFLSVLLSAFMLFSVLTVGDTFFKMQRMQNIRLNGAEFDAIMYGVTEEQLAYCEKNEDILLTGICAVAGYVEATEKDSTPNVGLLWADSDYWGTMMLPARESLQGEYPTVENEVMVTEESLKECGYENLGVGDTFSMTYGTPLGTFEKEFRISGKWDGYGAKKIFYMSHEFYENSGYQISEVASGRFHMDIRQKMMTQKDQDAFIEAMSLGKQQRLFFIVDMGYSIFLLTGILGLIGIICLCAYLLIYNVMYLSVSGDVRYYGLLQTIGMTERQIHSIIRRQLVVIGSGGTIGGIIFGAIVSFVLVPTVVKSLGVHTGQAGKVIVSFHPMVVVMTVFIVGITVMTAGRKPAKIAAKCSPMEALGYRPAEGTGKTHKTGTGKLLWRLAKKQIRKDKKKAGIVMVSLAASLSAFLCMVTLLSSQGAREYSYNYMDMDFILKNDTAWKEKQEERIPILDAAMLSELNQIEGVKEIHPTLFAEITVPWEAEFTDVWMREFYDMWMTIPYEDDIEEYKQHPENFGSSMVGIDQESFEQLNQLLEEPVDKEAFLKGDTCILYRNSLEFSDSDVAGKTITCAEYSDQNHTISFEIAGLTDENYHTVLLGFVPTVIVADHVVERFAGEPIICKAGIYYNEEYDQQTEEQILSVLENSLNFKDFSWDSKIELMKNVKKAQGNMMLVGAGLTFILALIGIMNYINTSISNVQSRQVELSVMESIGTTDQQMKRMLLLEGMLYAIGSLLVTMTVGLGVTYAIFQSMNYRGAPFVVPMVPVVFGVFIVFVICMLVPSGVWKK